MTQLYIIKIGGNIIDDEKSLSSFLQNFAQLSGRKILIHGGGRLATQLATQLQVPQKMVDGRRITDGDTLRIITMVYAGLINKNIVASLQREGCNAIGLSGADGNLIRAHKRNHDTMDYGFAGDVDEINAGLFHTLLEKGLVPVICPVTHDREGQLLNTNADTIAQEVAKTLGKYYAVTLVFSFEKSGVLRNVNDPDSVVTQLNKTEYEVMKGKGIIFAGMIPKLDNAFSALENGVEKIIIGQAEELPQLISGEKGTSIVNG